MGILTKVLGSSKSCHKLGASERSIGFSCFASSLHRIRAVHPPVWAVGSDVMFGLHQNISAPLHVSLLSAFCFLGFEPSAPTSISWDCLKNNGPIWHFRKVVDDKDPFGQSSCGQVKLVRSVLGCEVGSAHQPSTIGAPSSQVLLLGMNIQFYLVPLHNC